MCDNRISEQHCIFFQALFIHKFFRAQHKIKLYFLLTIQYDLHASLGGRWTEVQATLDSYYSEVKRKGISIRVQAWIGLRAPWGWGFRDFQTVGTWGSLDCQPYAPAAFTPQGGPLVLICVRGGVDPRAIVRSEGLSQWKISKNPTGNRTCDFPAYPSGRMELMLLNCLWSY